MSANGATTAGAPAPVSFVKKEETPKDKNAAGLKHLVSQMPSALSPFFQCEQSRRFLRLSHVLTVVVAVVRLFQTRRSSDVAQKQKIKEAAGILADVLVKHLEPQTSSKSHASTMGCHLLIRYVRR